MQVFSLRPTQVTAAIELLDGGATVPFIARYRKEATGTLDEEQLRQVQSLLEKGLAAVIASSFKMQLKNKESTKTFLVWI